MSKKGHSFLHRISLLRRQQKDKMPARNLEWLDYMLSKETLPLAIRGLTIRLVEEIYPQEAHIADLVTDSLLNEDDPQPMTATDTQKLDGLGFGTIVDLGSPKAYTFAAHVMGKAAELAEARSLLVPEAIRLLSTIPNLYDSLLAQARDEFGLEDKLARRFMEVTLDAIDPHFEFGLGQVFLLEEYRYCEFKKIESANTVNCIKDYAQIYIAAFLNRGGGRIYFGITDKDRIVKGEYLSDNQRNELQQKIGGKLRELTPPVTPDYYRINFHPVVDDRYNRIPDLVVVEIIVPLALDREPTRTQSGRQPIMGDGYMHKDCRVS